MKFCFQTEKPSSEHLNWSEWNFQRLPMFYVLLKGVCLFTS